MGSCRGAEFLQSVGSLAEFLQVLASLVQFLKVLGLLKYDGLLRLLQLLVIRFKVIRVATIEVSRAIEDKSY